MTVLMPVGPGSLFYLWRSLDSLTMQPIPCDVVCCPSAHAYPEIAALGKADKFFRKRGLKSFAVLPEAKAGLDWMTNIRNARQSLLNEARRQNADKVFWLDADIELPGGSLQRLTSAMDCDTFLSAVGLSYHRESDHLRMGCTLIRTAALDGFSFLDAAEPCECRDVMEYIRHKSNGEYVTEILPFARHLRYE